MLKKIICTLTAVIMLFNITVFADTQNPYTVEVNRATNSVSVYAPDEQGNYSINVKNFICSTGLDTPDGTFRTSDKYTWRFLFGDVYGQYATRITGHILFHSVPYYTQNKNDLEYIEYNKLGTTASMGCIRLTVEDAKWLYDNCPSGTTVKIFYDENVPVPKYKQPEIIDINNTEKRGWDPTDPDINNPWKLEEENLNSIISNEKYIINGNSEVLKTIIINGENYIYAREAGKFFKGKFVTDSKPNELTFRQFDNHISNSKSILTYLFKPYPVTNSVLTINYNGSTYQLHSKNINGYDFIRLEDAAHIFDAKISAAGGKTTIAY